MATSNEPTPSTQPTTCPLARDEDGSAIELPSGATAWRVRRQTGGRPRIVLGVDKQPMQVPLGYTIVDLEDILAPGAYRLDVVDAKGEPLGLTIAISIGQLRNADDSPENDNAEPVAISAMLPTSGSETRLVLEANVRATQMAFLHNQKTLELGLRMAESLRDGVRVMAEAQADWIKSMASARGFFRNAPPLPPPPAAEPVDDDEGDDDEDEDAPPPAAASWVEAITPIVGIVTQHVVQAVMSHGKKASPAAEAAPDSSKFELADLFDWRRAAAKRDAALTPAPSAVDLPSLVATLPPALVPKLIQVRSLLTSDEQERLMPLIAALEPEYIDALVTRAEKMTAEDLAEYLRAQLAKPAA
jgi:hypothetical protein